MTPELSERERQSRLAVLVEEARLVGRASGSPAKGAPGSWFDETDLRGSVRRLCVKRGLIAAARKRTRYWRTDDADDPAIVEQLCDLVESRADSQPRQAPSLLVESEDVAARVLEAEARRLLRNCLVTTLVEAYDIVDVAAHASSRAGIAGMAQQLAYCLVVLCQKSDPSRSRHGGPPAQTYRLDIGADDFSAQLLKWAGIVAANMRDWAQVYEAIQDEAEHYEIVTIRKLLPNTSADDVADVLADRLVTVLANGQRLDDMCLDLARAEEPSGGEYVFQSPLGRWVATSVRRNIPREHAGPLRDEQGLRSAGGDHGADSSELVNEVYRQLMERVAGLAESRDLPSAMEQADALEAIAARARVSSVDDSSRMQRFRAELAYVTDELRREHRALDAMLEYILLAMRCSPKLQRVAILSLRSDALDAVVVDDVARRLDAMVSANAAPSLALIGKTAKASSNEVPANRLRELTRLREDHAYRATAYAEIAGMLEALPRTVGELASMAEAMQKPTSTSVLATMRQHAARELASVDATFGRVFRRYATGSTTKGSAVQRFIADLPVDDEELTSAIAERAQASTLIGEAIVGALQNPEAAVRRRAAQRVARMHEVGPSITARLVVMAGSDEDLGARAAAVAALGDHSLAVPSARTEPSIARPRVRSTETSLTFRTQVMRDQGNRPILLLPRDRAQAPMARVLVLFDDDGVTRIQASGLPYAFVGERLEVRALGANRSTIAVSDDAVTDDGAVTILGAIDPDTLRGREIELLVAGVM